MNTQNQEYRMSFGLCIIVFFYITSALVYGYLLSIKNAVVWLVRRLVAKRPTQIQHLDFSTKCEVISKQRN
jgi:hypothetical protein